ncbi:hypothetical protein ABFS83_05G128500 [Erythranthe nasuta]
MAPTSPLLSCLYVDRPLWKIYRVIIGHLGSGPFNRRRPKQPLVSAPDPRIGQSRYEAWPPQAHPHPKPAPSPPAKPTPTFSPAATANTSTAGISSTTKSSSLPSATSEPSTVSPSTPPSISYSPEAETPPLLKSFGYRVGEFPQDVGTVSRQNSIINAVAVNDEGVMATGGDNGSLWFWYWESGTRSNKRQSTLEVLHQHGPCSRGPNNPSAAASPPPLLSEILSHDQIRVDKINARIKQTSHTKNQIQGKKVNLPIQSGRSLGSGNYIVTLGLGTPQKTLSLIFDMGSDLTWTQCQPCVKSCYQQQDPIFNPSDSTSYSNVSCNSPQCSQLSTATGNSPGCTNAATCVYGIQYGDQSFSVGFFSKDKLTIAPNEYGKYFSYCLPSTSSSTGHLTLGKTGNSRNVKFTPFATNQQGSSFYFIDIVSISVGGRKLAIGGSVFKAGGTIIDSGTVISRIPPTAYSALSGAFKKMMAKYKRAPAYSILDTCYDLSGYTSVTVPTVSFTFGGNVRVDLDPSGIIVAVGGSRVCLAFVGNSDDGDVGIFGNSQQKTMEVVYDVAGGNLGFGPAGCK